MTYYQRLIQWYRRYAGKEMIWPFRGSHDSAESVAVALDSGVITHLAVFCGNRETSDTLYRDSTQAAIGIASRHNIPVILMRGLWRTQPPMDVDDIKSWDYYDRAIAGLASDAQKIKAPYIGLDIEAYGPTPVTEYMRRRAWDDDDLHRIALCVGNLGKVDYVCPAGAYRRNHPYRIISALGRKRICEATYYDRTDTVDPITWPYEVTGRWINAVKDSASPAYPWLQRWLPGEILSDWRNDLFLWQEDAYPVACALRDAVKGTVQRG